MFATGCTFDLAVERCAGMVKLFQIRSIRDAQAADLINCREIDGVQLETISTRRRQYCLSCVRSQWRRS